MLENKLSGRTFFFFISVLLVSILLTGCTDFFDNSVTINGVRYSSDTESVVITGSDPVNYSDFTKLKNLKYIDITALDITSDEYETILTQISDDVTIIWSVPLSTCKTVNTAAEVSFSGAVSEDDAFLIKYFSDLKGIAITETVLDDNLATMLETVSENNPKIKIFCSAEIFGVAFDSTSEMLDLNNISVDTPEQICLAIELFPNIKTIEMCDCGLSNEIMQGLREEYPDVKFVWTVKFLQYKVRTDIQVFSTLATNYTRPGNTETFMPLFKYCTELRALDLGHMAITDISEIRNLKKLHTLILADNRISDISPISDLKELVYVELFQNRIADVSPLLELPKLEDLNLCYNVPMENPTVLTNCSKLKRLYISHCSLDSEEITQLKNGIPADCEFNYTAANCVHSGWRTTANARNTKIREAFKNWRQVKEYPTWDNIIYY